MDKNRIPFVLPIFFVYQILSPTERAATISIHFLKVSISNLPIKTFKKSGSLCYCPFLSHKFYSMNKDTCSPYKIKNLYRTMIINKEIKCRFRESVRRGLSNRITMSITNHYTRLSYKTDTQRNKITALE